MNVRFLTGPRPARRGPSRAGAPYLSGQPDTLSSGKPDHSGPGPTAAAGVTPAPSLQGDWRAPQAAASQETK